MKTSSLGWILPFVLAGCGGQAGESTNPTPPAAPITVYAAGDIAGANSKAPDTARLIEADPSTAAVLALGDEAYEQGTLQQFENYYQPTWGALKSKTYPAPGNHEYLDSSAAGYYTYFGSRAGPEGKGYYSFNLGSWHLICLNSEISSQDQLQWLQTDLAAAKGAKGILAFWHHPLFDSASEHAAEDTSLVRQFWKILETAKADIVLNGHEHNYQSYHRQDHTGVVPSWGGIREFIVGTGGESLYPIDGKKLPEFRWGEDTRYGVLRLSLGDGNYSWQFITTDGQVADSGGPIATNRKEP